MLDLHVWGSAFGLASIEPESIAIITYLRQAAPSSSFRIIPSNDPSVSPSNLLPALHHDGVWTSGYKPIITYLTAHSLCKDLDASLDARQRADHIAYSAYLAAHAAPLLDLSLYVSAANWSAATRPAYSELLPFPLTWTVPPLIRAEAISRAEHLGMAELDSDFDPNGGLHLSAGRDALPETFRRHLPTGGRKSVMDEMTPEQAVAIRLFGLTEGCLSVLDEVLAANGEGSKFFAGTQISSLDCLAFGYLVLMRDAPVPRSFLKDWLEENSPRLWSFIDNMKATSEDGPQTAQKEQTPALSVIGRTLTSCVLNAPGLGEHYANEMRYRAEQQTKGVDQRALILITSLMATSVALGYGYFFYKSLQPFGSRVHLWRASRGGTKLDQFGDLGFMLNNAMGSPQPTGFGGSAGRVVETDSELD